MATKQVTHEIYRKTAEGQSELVETKTFEVEVPTQEEVIAEKEAQLLEMYAELEALKAAQNGG